MIVRGYPMVLFLTLSFIFLLFIAQHSYRPQIHNLVSDVWPGGKPPQTDAADSQSPDLKPEQQQEAEQGYEHEYEHQHQHQHQHPQEHGQEQEQENEKEQGHAQEQSAEQHTENEVTETHHVLYSQSTSNRTYIKIDTGDHTIYNANIIPHPTNNETWIVIGQRGTEGTVTWFFSEIYCEATLVNDKLTCLKSPMTLTIPDSPFENCQGVIEVMNSNIGPHDARAFYGPDFPITTYGTTSEYTCFGQFALDVRTLMPWPEETVDKHKFRRATELQRPPPYAPLEKNWFLWWDTKGDMYAHYSIEPRLFSKVEWDGSASENVATTTATAGEDEKCLARYVPKTYGSIERDSIHQATNSLSVTLCKRSDDSCEPTEENTFTVAIFHHKKCRAVHNVYEPYAMVFKQDAPFSIYGISSKPLWINGRGKAGEQDQPPEEPQRPLDESEMIYVTSIGWKSHNQKHHGYLDDVMFLAFGLEDTRAGGIDVLASDLIDSLGLCSDA